MRRSLEAPSRAKFARPSSSVISSFGLLGTVGVVWVFVIALYGVRF